jgi:hypothetical protein
LSGLAYLALDTASEANIVSLIIIIIEIGKQRHEKEPFSMKVIPEALGIGGTQHLLLFWICPTIITI